MTARAGQFCSALAQHPSPTRRLAERSSRAETLAPTRKLSSRRCPASFDVDTNNPITPMFVWMPSLQRIDALPFPVMLDPLHSSTCAVARTGTMTSFFSCYTRLLPISLMPVRPTTLKKSSVRWQPPVVAATRAGRKSTPSGAPRAGRQTRSGPAGERSKRRAANETAKAKRAWSGTATTETAKMTTVIP